MRACVAAIIAALSSAPSMAGLITADYSYQSPTATYSFEGVVIFDDAFDEVIASNGAYGPSVGDSLEVSGINFLDFRMYRDTTLLTETVAVVDGMLTETDPNIRAVRFQLDVLNLVLLPQMTIGDVSVFLIATGLVSPDVAHPGVAGVVMFSSGRWAADLELEDIAITPRIDIEPPPIEMPIVPSGWLLAMGCLFIIADRRRRRAVGFRKTIS